MQQYSSLIFIVIIIAVMYFMMIRPQKKRQQQHAETLRNLKKGDHVVTIGRLHGVVDSIDQDHKTVSLDCSGVYLEFDLNAIASVEQQTTTSADTKADNSEDATEANAPESKEASDDQDSDHSDQK